MRLTGYCEKCHRVRTVSVSRWLGRGVPTGTCVDCEEKEDKKRAEDRVHRNPR